MAWFSSGSTNTALITNLAKNGLITSDRVKTAMLSIDRAHYTPPTTTTPYTDSPQPLGHAGATISAPHMHAAAAEALLPYLHPTARVLDIGSGSGYLTAVLAALVGPGGRVVGVEHVQALVEMAEGNVGKSVVGRQWLGEGRVRFVKGDGRVGLWDREGLSGGGGGEEEGCWDAIHVGAAAREAHAVLVKQLRRPGRLFIPVGEEGGMQYIWVIDKGVDGTVTRRRDMGVRYVPLTDAPEG